MLITKTERSISQVLIWSADSSSLENHRNLAQIIQWWGSLDGKTIRWELFSEALNLTTPIIAELLVIESPLVEGLSFKWRKQGLENWNTIKVQHLVLDYSFQKLEIVPSLQDGLVSKYRVKIVD